MGLGLRVGTRHGPTCAEGEGGSRHASTPCRHSARRLPATPLPGQSHALPPLTWMHRSRAVALLVTPSTFCSAALPLRYTCGRVGVLSAWIVEARHGCCVHQAKQTETKDGCLHAICPCFVVRKINQRHSCLAHCACLFADAAATGYKRGVDCVAQRHARQLHTCCTFAQFKLHGWQGEGRET